MKNKKRLLLFLLVFGLLNVVVLYFFATPLSSMIITGKITDSGLVRIYVEGDLKTVTVYNPENTTHDSDNYTCSGAGHPKCDNFKYILPLNVSADFFVENTDGWNYSLYDLKHGVYVEENVLFTPNTTINAVRWGNKLYVSAKEEDANRVTQEVIFTVEVPSSSPILGDISDHVFVCEGERLDERFNATDVDEEILDDSISPSNPFYVDYLGKSGYNVSLFRIISGTLDKGDLGDYNETISVVDPTDLSDSATTNISVIEINNLPVMENLGAQTVWMSGADSNFYYQMDVNDVEDGVSGDGNMTFNLSWGNDENLFDINSSTGVMNYTPSAGHEGSGSLVYSLVVCVEDNPLDSAHENISLCSPRSNNSEVVCDSFTLTVTDKNRAPEIVSYSPSTSFSVPGTTTSTFSVEVADEDGTVPDISWYVGAVLKEQNENVSNDTYSYSFGCGVSGTYNITMITTDGLLNTSQVWEINVTKVDCPVASSGGGGDGGGGGAMPTVFLENWVCDEWGVCQNVKKSFEVETLSPEDYYLAKEICAQNNYDARFCGFQITQCQDINSCNNLFPVIPKPSEKKICYFTENPNCQDGITNCHDGACELLVDCGGPCLPCPTCSDGKKNQREKGVDCGGPCPYACETEEPFNIISFVIVGLFIILLVLVIFAGIKFFSIVRFKHGKK